MLLEPNKIKNLLDQLFIELNKFTLLGAALDCMSEDGKQHLREKFEKSIYKELMQ